MEYSVGMSWLLTVITIYTCATLLQTESGQDLLKFGVCAEFGQLDMHTTTQTSTQVRGAGQDETNMLIPHESMFVLLEDLLNLCYCRTRTTIY